MNLELITIVRGTNHKYCGFLIALFFVTVQCSWTPEIQTPIHRSENGHVILQTFSHFKTPPQHPQDLSPALIKKILQGITQSQERGILQELFISDQQSSPVFSPAQIEFLTPYIGKALTMATSEELIAFQSRGDSEGTTPVKGTITLFPSSILFLTLQNSGSYSRNPSKPSSVQTLYTPLTLSFPQKGALLTKEESKQYMKTSSKASSIAINYAVLSASTESQKKEENVPTLPIQNLELLESQDERESLQKELQEMRKAVDEQAREIRVPGTFM